MYRGFFINLARNQERRQSLTRHLEEVGAAARYQRFEAVDGRAVAPHCDSKLDPGALGCWLSHQQLLSANRAPDVHLHVLEDDTIFARDALPQFEFLLQHADGQSRNWDILFTDIMVSPDDGQVFRLFSEQIQRCERRGTYALLSLENIPFAGMHSYFVSKRSVEKVVNLLWEQWKLGLPIDLYLRDLVRQRRLQASVVLPFLTTVSPWSTQSDIRGPVNRSHAVYDLYRQLFFKDVDLRALQDSMQGLIRGVKISPRTAIYLQALYFSLSDQHVAF